jgi:hypothetical protein
MNSGQILKGEAIQVNGKLVQIVSQSRGGGPRAPVCKDFARQVNPKEKKKIDYFFFFSFLLFDVSLGN